MNFSPLDKLLIADRKFNQRVAFSNQSNKNWHHFITDIADLSAHLRQQTALRWAICCQDSYLFSVAFFAAAYADKQLILPGNHQPEMLALLAQQFDGLLTDEDLLTTIKSKHCLLPFAADKKAEPIKQILDINNVSLLLYTSGSNGFPKAIHKTLALLDTEIHSLQEVWGKLLTETEIVSSVSHQHIYGLLFRILWPLCAGRAINSVDLIYPEQVIKAAKTNRTLIASPALLKRLSDTCEGAGYRAIFSSGGALNYETARHNEACLKQLPIEVFGSTETGGIAYRQQQSAQTPWTLFSPLRAQCNEQGCLLIKSPWIDNAEFYQTSDQCELLNERQFLLKGRIDRIVKIEEKRIALTEVELRINELPWIAESAVILLNSQTRLCLGAVIKLTEQGVQALKKQGKGQFCLLLRQQLRLWIEPIAIPRYFRIVDEIPVNRQGKQLHNELSALFNDHSRETDATQ
ncbi:AMP-binding protein [Psychromonas sp. MME2]|uniref:AMP-binding protein n=1 Tax=unclassified Psychromonas TaxID=2614957 RepID=UPI00339BA729